MTRRRALFCLILGLALVISLGLGCVYLSDSRRITRERFESVKVGMSWEQVIAIVGGPPGEYTTGPYLTAEDSMCLSRYDRWVCDEGELQVEFDNNGVVTDILIGDVSSSPRLTLIQRIRGWVGL